MAPEAVVDDQSITVVVIEDHALLRDAIRAFIRECDDIQIVGEAGTADEGSSLVAARQPTIALLDINLPGKSGLDVARRIQTQSPSTRVLVLTAYDYPQYVRAVIQAGAYGYILKSATRDQVLDAIRAVARGETVLDPGIGQAVVRAFAVGEAERRGDLTVRELDVIRLIADGRRNHEIATELVVMVSTIETHVRNILRQLGVSNRTHAVKEARERGLLVGDA